MERKRFQRIVVTIALIGALFMFGTETKKADAYIAETAYFSIVAGFYQGAGEIEISWSNYSGDWDYVYNAYVYYDAARSAAYNAAYYASYSSNYYAYDAYLEAMSAYDYLDTATYYAYDAWYYYDNTSWPLSFYYGGLAAEALAYTQYYAAYL